MLPLLRLLQWIGPVPLEMCKCGVYVICMCYVCTMEEASFLVAFAAVPLTTHRQAPEFTQKKMRKKSESIA